MPFHFKALSAALSIIAAAVMVGPGRAQESPPAAAQEPAPNAAPQDGPTRQAPPAGAPVRAGRAGSAAVIANVNLRSGPGTDSDVVTTIPAGSTVRVTSCSGEWCEVTWNGRSGYAIARNLSIGAPRQAGPYGPGPRPGYAGGYGPQPGYTEGYRPRPGYAEGYGPEPPAVYEAPGYYAPPGVVYGPGYYYGPGVYYRPGWGWRRRWWW
ncbi:MAG TPA: SH3 domain-containing protein [Xanthobacteraceae bacterium]|nr:SH3 domain-containing protein [Xanthobacteraceae bacterium]